MERTALFQVEAVAIDRSVRIIDIRSRQERLGSLGYIPGSRLFPGELLAANTDILADAYPKETPIAIACQSGRRAEELAPTLRAAGFEHAAVLTGGILAWGAADLPLCGVSEIDPSDIPSVATFERLPRVVMACFIASMAEYGATDGSWGEQDPIAVVEQLMEEEHRGGAVSRETMERVIDRLAEIARANAFPHDVIRLNVDRMVAAIRTV